jgi:hypothetical protein
MNTSLRQHQADAANAVIKAINDGKKRILFAIATGGGKMLTVCHIISQLFKSPRHDKPVSILFVCDKQEFVHAALDVLSRNFDIQASSILEAISNVHAVTIQKVVSASERGDKLPLYDFIFIYGPEWLGLENDSKTRSVLENFPNATFIGVDSFPDRSIAFFGPPVFAFSITDGISKGILVDYRFINVRLDSKEPKERIKRIATTLAKEAENGKTIVYCENQNDAELLTAHLNEIAQSSEYSRKVISSSPDNNNTINQFRNNKLPQILTTVDLLAGVSLPNVRNIAFTRKIRSYRYLTQIISNGLLPFDGKSFLTIIDFTGGENLFQDSALKKSRIVETRKIGTEPDEHASSAYIPFTKSNISVRDTYRIDGVLGVNELASEMAEIISEFPKEPGHMIGIFGKWGRGKTFLMNEIWSKLQRENYTRVDFHAWKYQDTSAAWAYLFERFADEFYRSAGSFVSRVYRKFRLNVERAGSLPLLWFITSFSVYTVIYFLFDFDEKYNFFISLLDTVGWTVILYPIIIYFKYGQTAKNLFNKYFSRSTFDHLLGLQAEVQKELNTLIHTWSKFDKNLSLVLFVDDIDRCSEKKIIEIVDALRVMLEDPLIAKRLIVIAAIDERILRRAIRLKYAKLLSAEKVAPDAPETELSKMTAEYFDKLFILGVKLGDLSMDERIEFFQALTKDSISEVRDVQLTGRDSLVVSNVATDNSLSPDSDQHKNSVMEHNEETHPTADRKVIDNSVKSDRMSQEEFTLLCEALKTYHTATPRQIRIFYYRYLLLKNLLARAYSLSGQSNYWALPKNTRVLIQLIVYYSLKSSTNEIAKHRSSLYEAIESNVSVFMHENRQVPKLDYLILLRTMDMVIAY